MKRLSHIVLAVFVLLVSACEDRFLDLEPLDSITEAAYFEKPEHFKAYANGFYDKMLSWRKIDESNIFDYMDFGTDLTSYTQPYGRGVLNPPTEDVYWTRSYKYIRANNILIQKANQYGGDFSQIAQYAAEAHFFRAYHHFFLLQRFGGVPIVTTVLDLDSPELKGERRSRYEVVAQILNDLDVAITDLPLEQNISAADKGHISRWAAEAFKAKVLLYEATWERYVGTSTDGDGATNGAGSEMPDGYPTVESMLSMAVDHARNVMDNGGFQLWNHNDELNNSSMYYLFNLEDAGSNPAGLDKSTNKEFILYSKYDFDLYQGNINLSHTVGSRMAPTRKLMDMFLCADGLPVDQSPLFQGYQNTQDEYQNRDYRLTSYFAFDNGDIPQTGDVSLQGPGGDSGSGYSNRKFRAYNYGSYRGAEEESQDYPHIRLAEVYLIYAEALYELNGSITDEQMNASINKVKARAGLPALTNAFADANGLDIKEEIRRERAVELYGENSRYNDLKRWGIAEEVLNEDIVGSVIEGTVYDNNPDLYTSNAYPYGEITVETGVGERSALLLDPASNRNFERTHYLFPIPLEEIQLNKNLNQNPGY